MGGAYKNFWSLNIDEAIVAGILRNNITKDLEVFVPLNAQMKDIDLITMNVKNKKVATIQVKGSKAYEPKVNEIKRFGEGSGGWFFFPKENITRSDADYFIFLVYVLKEVAEKGRRIIEPHLITIPTQKLIELCEKNKTVHGDKRYSFYFWVKPHEKKAFDFRDELYDVTEFLDENGLRNINSQLK
jgi:hypothetical protein